MKELFPLFIIIVLAILGLLMLARKIRVAYPVLLVIAGAFISVVPGMPRVQISPDLIFLFILPPLLYEACWSISWKELWHWRRLILSFAFVVVFITAVVVAWVANHFIPGFSIALGFLLGGIVSPPDAVSAGAILKFVTVPKRLSSILEGESLLNDASSLIIFRFALIAVGTGQFIWYTAAASFLWMVFGGAAIGLAVGWLIMQLHRRLPTDENIDTVITLVTPYIMYLAAEELHNSGVLSVVCGGLLLANRRTRFIPGSSRLRSISVWESLVFVLNGLVFMAIGLSLPAVTAGLEGVSLRQALGYGILISAVLIVVRIISAYGAVVVTLIMRNFITVADPNPPARGGPFIIGWAGMRGVVSLAAALSVPLTLPNGAPFPGRNLIIFITFVVIFITLCLQGLTLPWLIKRANLPGNQDYLPDDVADHQVKTRLSAHANRVLQTEYAAQLSESPYLQQLSNMWQNVGERGTAAFTPESRQVHLELLDKQRQYLQGMNHVSEKIDEDIIRKHLRRIDLEEERLHLV